MNDSFVPSAIIILLSMTACSHRTQDLDNTRPNTALVEQSEDSPRSDNAMNSSIKGVASYRERIALPADARFEAEIQDVSRADAPSQVIARTVIQPAGQSPFRFVINYDAARLQRGHDYAVRAAVQRGEQLLFTTDRRYSLPPSGDEMEMLLVRAAPPVAARPAATVSLENTYWKLVRLGPDVIANVVQEREPHLLLHADQKRVAGYGGCNRFSGTYTASGDTLKFSQMAVTMMACPDGMQYERAFYDALIKVSAWRIVGNRLELIDDAGSPVADFESRHMR